MSLDQKCISNTLYTCYNVNLTLYIVITFSIIITCTHISCPSQFVSGWMIILTVKTLSSILWLLMLLDLHPLKWVFTTLSCVLVLLWLVMNSVSILKCLPLFAYIFFYLFNLISFGWSVTTPTIIFDISECGILLVGV